MVRSHLDELYDTQFIDEMVNTPGVSLYLFGGPVRDLVLGRDWKDPDMRVAVEGGTMEEKERIVEDALARAGVPIKGVARIPRIDLTVYRFVPKNSASDMDIDLSLMPTLHIEQSDFVMNSLFFNLGTGELIDVYNAIDDIENKVLRTLREPEKEFQENPIAIHRALRQSCQHDVTIEKGTMNGLIEKAAHAIEPLRYVVEMRDDMWAEYYLANILKGFTVDPQRYFTLLVETGAYEHIEAYVAKLLHGEVPNAGSINPFDTQAAQSDEHAIAIFLSHLCTRVHPEDLAQTFTTLKDLLTLNTEKKYKDLTLDQSKIQVVVPV